MKNNTKIFLSLFLTLLIFLCSVLFLRTPGTGDLDTFVEWANTADKYGVVEGYKISNADYPPFTAIISLVAIRFFRLFEVGGYGAIKLSLLFFLILTVSIFWLWTRDLLAAQILYLSLILNSTALGYTDIYFLPSFLIALWSLKEQKLIWFSIFFAFTIFTKWQPAIIIPIIGIYLIKVNRLSDLKNIEFRKLAKSVLLPAVIFLGLLTTIYDLPRFSNALKQALTDPYLSGNALNFNWIVTYYLQDHFPVIFGGLVEGQANLIPTYLSHNVPLFFTLSSKFLFVFFYLATCLIFSKIENKSFEHLVFFSLIGYFSYFIFNTGVHENHLILAMVLSVILFWLKRDYGNLMALLILITNINLFIFYGVSLFTPSDSVSFSRVIGVDSTLVFSLFNVGLFLYLWWTMFISNHRLQIKK